MVYPYSAAKDDKSGVKDAATLLSAQDGTLNANLDVRVGAGTIRTTTPGLDVTTQPAAQFAIFKFTLGSAIDGTHPLYVKDDADNTIITVTPASSTTTAYVAMPANGTSTTYKFLANTANNRIAKSGAATITAGKYYQTTLAARYPLALSSATAEWDLGAVACDDGNLYMEKKAAPAGKTAIGIVGKVTETGHGLILALQDATEQSWNTINSWESVTTYADTKLKLLPDDARGSLTSYFWLGGIFDHIMVSNWCVAQKSDYDEIFVNLGSTDVNSNGTTYDGNVNAYITTGVGGTAMTSNNYWSATEYDVNFAWNFGYGWYELGKGISLSVRPVLGF